MEPRFARGRGRKARPVSFLTNLQNSTTKTMSAEVLDDTVPEGCASRGRESKTQGARGQKGHVGRLVCFWGGSLYRNHLKCEKRTSGDKTQKAGTRRDVASGLSHSRNP